MPDGEIDNLKIRLDVLQENVWSNEEKISRNLESIAKQESEVFKLKTLTELLMQKLATLEKAIDQMKEAEEVKDG